MFSGHVRKECKFFWTILRRGSTSEMGGPKIKNNFSKEKEEKNPNHLKHFRKMKMKENKNLGHSCTRITK